jgi:hypothetical protein
MCHLCITLHPIDRCKMLHVCWSCRWLTSAATPPSSAATAVLTLSRLCWQQPTAAASAQCWTRELHNSIRG